MSDAGRAVPGPDRLVSEMPLPVHVFEVDASWLEGALRTRLPDLAIHSLTIREVQVSTATRVLVDLEYSGGAGHLPGRLCVKGGFDCEEYAKKAFVFRREAHAYAELLPHVPVRRPACYFSAVDEGNGQGVVILEDIVAAGGTANRALEAPTVDGAAGYLEQLAALHAGTWDAPILERLPWLVVAMSDADPLRNWWDEPQLTGYLERDGRAEVVDPALCDPSRLLGMLASLEPVASQRPRVALHGDPHIGNTYRDAAGRAAFLDWQGINQGPWARDVSYFMASNLTVDDRRAHERDLLAHYLDGLAAYGVTPPDQDEAWAEYRRWMIVPLLIWIGNSDLNQPREANRVGSQRVSTAMMDLDVLDLYA